MNLVKKITLTVVATVLAAFSVLVAQPAYAEMCPPGSIKQNQDVTNLAECNIKDDDSLMLTIQTIINVIISILGIIAVIVIILGGFTYITSSGDAAKLTKAKNTILYGVVGLIVALLAYAIVNFVLDGVFKAQSSSTAKSSYTTESDCTKNGGKWDASSKKCS